jgi:hypothetical protein
MRSRIAGCLLVLAAVSLAVGCGDDGGDDEPRIERDQAFAILLQQGYTSEGATCVMDNLDLQNVDLTSVYARDQITPRELEVLASVQQFCLDRYPMATTASTGPVPTPPTTG